MKMDKIVERKRMVKETDGTQEERKKNSPAGILAVKKSIFTAFALLAAWTLTGCSLATEAGNRISGGDRLVGVFVTTEYVDVVDWDHADASALMKGEVSVRDREKICGSFDQEKSEYVFDGLEGYSLGMMYLKSDDGEEYLASAVSDCIGEVNLNMGDMENTCSGVLYFDRTQIGSEYVTYEDESWKEIYKGQDVVVNQVIQEDGSEAYELCTDGKELHLYANAVYETGDGQLYLVPNSGVQVSTAAGNASMTLTDTAVFSSDGEHTETRNTIAVTYRGVSPAESVKFSWQDENGKVIKEKVYEADRIPSSIKWEKNTAYIIAALQNGDGTADYNLIGRDDESYTLHLTAASLILKNVEVAVER